MMPKTQPVIIIKKARHGKHAHHGGAWKVAYADFVTAMMAFFLVMWLINTSPQVRSPMASYFRDPGVFDHTSGGGAAPGASMGSMAGNATTPPVAAAKAALEETAETIRRQLESLPDFPQIKGRVEMQVTAEGLRIELIDQVEHASFDVGSANLRPEIVDVLRVITDNVRRLATTIAIEGHTDGRPYGSEVSGSNWELSSARANAARRAMEAAGLKESQLEALHGYGNSHLRYPKDPLDSRNRRIAIVVRGAGA
jgi:chemotaxis protein MotB